jgi:peptide chain release factor 2
MKRISYLKEIVDDWNQLKSRIDYLCELALLDDETLRRDLTTELTEIEHDLERREFDVLLSGKFDRNNALLAIHAGAGGPRCWSVCTFAGQKAVNSRQRYST